MRPYVICHMTISIDGKVTGSFLESKACAPAIEEYYRLNREITAEAFACGRVTMEESFTGGYCPDLSEFAEAKVKREDFIAVSDASRYAVAFDRRGRLGWTSSVIEDDDPGYGGAHIVEVLCEDVSDAYLAYLRSIGVSYLFAGNVQMNLKLALEKLKSKFSVNHLLLEGGSEINGAFESAGLIDELSLVQASVAADTESKPLFAKSYGEEFVLSETKAISEQVLYLRYLKKNLQTSPNIQDSGKASAEGPEDKTHGCCFDVKQLKWTRAPRNYSISPDKIQMITEPYTDLWQRTYYHFRNDNAPVLQMETDERFFSFIVKTEFESRRRFDQCGIVMYLDSDNWLKASIEYENEKFQHLGSVVTNNGYSDWATTEIDAGMKSMWYRFSRREDDYCIECSQNGADFQQMRVCHMWKGGGTIRFGVYACSPEDSAFQATFSEMEMTACQWLPHDGQKPDSSVQKMFY